MQRNENLLDGLSISNFLAQSNLQPRIEKEIQEAKQVKNHFIALLSLRESCNLACDYCYEGDKPVFSSPPRIMQDSTLESIVTQFMDFFYTHGGSVEFLFHGPEVTLDIKKIRKAIETQKSVHASLYSDKPLYRKDCTNGGTPLVINTIQTNATRINEELLSLTKEGDFRNLSISLDGPREIHDAHRVYKDGTGSFQDVMKSIDLARKNDVNVAAVAVLTRTGLGRIEDIYSFFKEEQISFRLNPVLKPRNSNLSFTITPQEYAQALNQLTDMYISDPNPNIKVVNIDQYFQQIYDKLLKLRREDGSFRSFGDLTISDIFAVTCQGFMCAISTVGDIYPCERILDVPEFLYGNIRDGLETIFQSPRRMHFIDRVNYLPEGCTNCDIFSLCYGGCPAAAYCDTKNISSEDPFCEAYKSIFSHLGKIVTDHWANKGSI